MSISTTGPINPATGAPEWVREEENDISQRFGEPPTITRRVRETRTLVSGGQAPGSLLNELGISLGSAHPVVPVLTCVELSESENTTNGTDGFKIERQAQATYTADQEVEPDANPLLHADKWSFQTQGASVPAFLYFEGNALKPMTNSAGDWLRGPQVDEAQTKVIIKGNRPSFPSATATSITNCVNSAPFLGGAAGTWKCQGISGFFTAAVSGEGLIPYWEVTVELLYRQTGWNLLIPDVGYNYLEGGVRKRATVKTKEDGVEIDLPSADVVPLNGSGGLSDVPTILSRRVYKEIDFSSYFGTPPA